MQSAIIMPTEGQQQAAAQNLYLTLYMNLIPVVAEKRLDRIGESWRGEELPASEAIALEAEEIAKAAMKKLGIVVH